MLQENLIKMFEVSFREHHNLPALTDYFGKDSLSYFEMSEKIARLHLLFEEYGIQKGDRIALIGRNNVNWCDLHSSCYLRSCYCSYSSGL